MHIIGFFSKDTPYEEEAKEFAKSLDKFSLTYSLYPVENKGNWELNCAQKANVCMKGLQDHSDNILYLDVDARILREPPWDEIEDDTPGYAVLPVRFKEWPCLLASGTIYFPNNETSRNVVTDWLEYQTQYPTMWDQRTLQKVHINHSRKYLDLKWCTIEDNYHTKKISNPVVFHTQASRRLKYKL